MNETPDAPTDKPRSRAAALTVAIVLAAGLGVWVGARWHDVFERWLPGHAHDDAAETASATGQLWTCGMHPQVIQDHPGLCPICHMELTPLGDTKAEDNAITIDPSVVQNMGVKTTIVGESALVRTVRAFGTVEEAESNVHEVNLLVSGRIRRLYADTEGMRIEKYAPLFDLYSPELHAAIDESIRLRRSTPSADPEGAAGGGRRSLYAASLQRLELWGLSSAQAERLSKLERAPRSVTFTSPIAGVLVEKNVVEGAAVRAGEAALKIVDHRVVWLEARVFEQHLAAVTLGQQVVATVDAFPGETFAAKVAFVHPHVEPDTRTAVVRIVVDNAAMRLRPGMFATVELELELATKTLVVPSESVIDTGTRKVAFVALGDGRFEPRVVQTGLVDGVGHVQVLAGLQAGDDVVTSGQFLLDSESRMREAVQKFLRERDTTTMEPAPPEREVIPPLQTDPPKPAATRRKEPPRSEPASAPVPEPTIYTCPMHPEVRKDAPGSCPVCGMDLVPSEETR